MRNKKYFLNILIILLIGGTSIYLSIGEQFDQVLLSFQEAKISLPRKSPGSAQLPAKYRAAAVCILFFVFVLAL